MSTDNLEFKLVVTQTTPEKPNPLSILTVKLEYPDMPNAMANVANVGMTMAALGAMAAKSEEYALGKAQLSGDQAALEMISAMKGGKR